MLRLLSPPKPTSVTPPWSASSPLVAPRQQPTWMASSTAPECGWDAPFHCTDGKIELREAKNTECHLYQEQDVIPISQIKKRRLREVQ